MSKIYQALERVDRGHTAGADSPASTGHAHWQGPDGSEYESLGHRIVQARSAAPFTTIMVTAPDHGEGASTVAAGLAHALAARAGLRVVLVDANFRHPGLSNGMADVSARGLADVAMGQASLDEAMLDTGVPGLRFLPAGDLDVGAARVLEAPGLMAALQELAANADVIVLDASPILPYGDALTLAPKIDRVIVVTQADRTQRGHLERSKDELLTSGAAILGVVLNRKTSHAPPWLQRRLNL